MSTLGGNTRPLDLRDIKLETIQPLGPIPESYQTDVSWLEPIWQSNTPSCGAHAWAHLKAILDHFDTGNNRYSPRYSWLRIKEIDGLVPEVGTNMRAIFKAGASQGAADYELLPNVFPTTTVAYSSKEGVPMDLLHENAHPRIIKAYAFGSVALIKEHIFRNKAVLILADIGETWWGQKVVWPFKKKDSGHFFVGYGYDQDYLYIIDSADKNVPLKKLSLVPFMEYPLREVGTAVDIPDEEVKRLIARRDTLQKLVSALQALLNAVKGFNWKKVAT